MNPMGSILVPVTVTTKGHLSFVSLNFKDSKVLRLMQLLVAPVSYRALIVKPKLLIGKNSTCCWPYHYCASVYKVLVHAMYILVVAIRSVVLR